MTAQIIAGHTDVLETLQGEHEEILRVFEEFKAAAGLARVKPFAQLKIRLRQHIAREEAEFYPLVEAIGAPEAALVATAETEHDSIQAALDTIETAGAEAASGGEVTTLETALKDHITSERGDLFAAARTAFTPSQKRQMAANLKTTASDNDVV